jgi:hypothetical protein
VHSHALSEALLHDGDKGAVCREINVGKGEVGRNRTPRKRAAVVRLKVGHLLSLVAVLEVGIRLVGLVVTGRGQ